MSSAVTLATFIFDADTRSFTKNLKGCPRILESYVSDRRLETVQSWTKGIALRDLLTTTAAWHDEHTQDATHWALLKSVPVSLQKVDDIRTKKHDSFRAWCAWQDVRVFSENDCQCPHHQLTAFCKHCAAAIAYNKKMSMPPESVISAVGWNRKLLAFTRIPRSQPQLHPTTNAFVTVLAAGVVAERVNAKALVLYNLEWNRTVKRSSLDYYPGNG